MYSYEEIFDVIKGLCKTIIFCLICLIIVYLVFSGNKAFFESRPCQDVCHKEVEECVAYENDLPIGYICEDVWKECLKEKCYRWEH